MTKNPLEIVKTLPEGFVKGAVAEVLHWRRTGLLPDACRLREIANELGGEAEDEYSLRRAEEAVMTVAASRWAGLRESA